MSIGIFILLALLALGAFMLQNKADDSQETSIEEWNEQVRTGKPHRSFKERPSLARVLFSGPFKRRTVLHEPNPRYGIEEKVKQFLKLFKDPEEVDTEFIESLNNI